MQLRAELNVAAPTKPRALSRSEMDLLFDGWASRKDIGVPRWNSAATFRAWPRPAR
ncbi:hypothetical protein VSR69_45610 [Paraburkholderia phytofirmans]